MLSKSSKIAISTGFLLFTPAFVFAQQTPTPTSGPVSAEAIAAAINYTPSSKGAALILPISALSVPEIAASVPPIATNPETGVAMEGYDPVGYFTVGEATKGDEKFQAEYQGATFHFTSEDNRELFVANPERFAPAYGGYCTKTVAQGALTPASPLSWTIHGDRLFLTRSPEAGESFQQTRIETISAGDKYWADASDAFQLGPNASAHGG